MSINSRTLLPNDVRGEDVIEAIAFMCGAKRLRSPLAGTRPQSYYVSPNRHEVSTEPNRKAKYVWVTTTHQIQFHHINLAETSDGESHRACLFTKPSSEYPGYVLLYAGVSPFWQAIAKGLINMFGGKADFNDCDGKAVDYRRKKPRKSNCPQDGKAWQEFQDAMYALPVLYKFADMP